MKVGLLVSGKLGHICLSHIKDEIDLVFVFTDRNSHQIINTCKEKGIPHFIGNPRKGRAAKFLQTRPAELVLSVNYLFIVEQDILYHASGYAINIHGSLLPKYRGRTPHVWAIINGETKTGITAHVMTEGCDEGDVILQKEIPVSNDATGGDVLREFEAEYPDLLKEVIKKVAEGDVKLHPQNHHEATFFGKRTPEDGLIDWNWSRNQIRNWIRAQAAPYPGAFTYLKNSKITIHKAELDGSAIGATVKDGTVLSVDVHGLTVKTRDGALRLFNIEGLEPTGFTVGDVLGEKQEDTSRGSEMLSWREAGNNDMLSVYEWANLEDARKNSYSQKPIPYADHVKWFRSRILEGLSEIYIFSDQDGNDTGYVRFDLDPLNNSVISIVVDANQRGKGHSTRMIDLGTRLMFENSNCSLITAYIFKSNTVSLKSFIRAGYQLKEEKIVKGIPSFVYQISKK
ncbi:MAG: hypothetical protein HEP71_28595 [Roseivirga sp.]|nr:hypothetical protein [Roseivirga sp.]